MKLSRQIDYHGSRAYPQDLPSAAEGGWLKRFGGRLAAWTSRKLELALRPGAETGSREDVVRPGEGKELLSPRRRV